MTPEAIKDLLSTHGHESRVRGNEVLVRTCLACGNPKWNLELNPAKGVFKCWVCPAKGSLQKFFAEYLNVTVRIPVNFDSSGQVRATGTEVDIPGLPANEVPSVCTYLLRRGFDPHILAVRYGVKICHVKEHRFYPRIIVPVRDFFTQETAGFVARAYLGESPKYLADTGSQIMGYRVRHAGTLHVLTEGVFDGINVHLAGFNAGILLGMDTLGEVEAWVSRIPESDPVGVLLDGEAEEQSKRLWWRLRAIRPDALRFSLPKHLDPANIHPDILARFLEVNMTKEQAATL